METNNMDVFLAVLIAMMVLSVALYIIVHNLRCGEFPDKKKRVVPVLLFINVLLIICDLCRGNEINLSLPLDIILSIAPMLVITSGLWERKRAQRVVWYMTVPAFLMIIVNILQISGVIRSLPSISYIKLCAPGVFLISIEFFVALYFRIREVKLVMNIGNVWFTVSTLVGFSYLLLVLIPVVGLMLCLSLPSKCLSLCASIVSILLAGELMALGLRATMDSLFLVCRKHERRIVESMKVSRIEVSSDNHKVDTMYRDVYERVVSVFETQKPYLNSELTINDIVKLVFTNKLYISKAISQFTGRNFCQFVNYYRVNHSIMLFKENPDLRVLELANMSGFNSAVSYGMAFRLYMNENPSDWCRKERAKQMRKKK